MKTDEVLTESCNRYCNNPLCSDRDNLTSDMCCEQCGYDTVSNDVLSLRDINEMSEGIRSPEDKFDYGNEKQFVRIELFKQLSEKVEKSLSIVYAAQACVHPSRLAGLLADVRKELEEYNE